MRMSKIYQRQATDIFIVLMLFMFCGCFCNWSIRFSKFIRACCPMRNYVSGLPITIEIKSRDRGYCVYG
jgi:hypothetical protein